MISERRDLNFSLRTLDSLCFSFLRTEFFFVDEVYDGTIDPRKLVCSFEFLFRDKVGHGSKNCIFPTRQSLLMSAASGEIKFDKFAARREERSPLKSPFFCNLK